MELPYKGSKKRPIEHGGGNYEKKGLRKTARPFDPQRPLFITMRSKKAVGERSMLHPKRIKIIREIVYRSAKRQGMIIKKYVCVGNHLHILIETKSRRMFIARPALRAFMREVSGLIARVMTGAKKGVPGREKFWDYLAWSRIVSWGRHLKNTYKYFEKNCGDAYFILRDNLWFDSIEFATGPPP